jgi:hypothetical protein
MLNDCLYSVSPGIALREVQYKTEYRDDILDTHCWGTYIRYIRLHLYRGDVDALSEMLWRRQKYLSTSLSAHRANNRQALFKISAINSIQSMIMLRNY